MAAISLQVAPLRALRWWLITVAALTALARTDQLASHMGRALDNGVTQEELAEGVNTLRPYLSSRVWSTYRGCRTR